MIPYLTRLGSPSFRRRVVELIPSKRIQRIKSIIDTMHETSTEIFRNKKAALEKGDDAVLRQLGAGKDIMSILCMSLVISTACLTTSTVKANLASSASDRLDEEELISQMS